MPKVQSDKPQDAPPTKPTKAAATTKAATAAKPKQPPTGAAATAKTPTKTGAPSAAKPAAAAAKAAKSVPVATPPGTAPAKTPAVEPAAAAQPVTATLSEAADENPLHKKLRLRPEDTGVIIAPPQGDDNPLLPLPASFLVLDQAAALSSSEGKFDYIHVFARDRADLIESFPLLRDKLAPGGSLWISWLKQSGRGAGRFDDLNDNVIRRLGLTHALIDVKVAALDRDWAALRLVHRKR